MIESSRASDFDQNWYPVARAELPPPAASFAGLQVSGEELNLLC